MHHDPLEKSIHQLLRNLPDRAAPATLEARVMATIAARASLPWWKRPITQWPTIWRSLFLLVSIFICFAGIGGFLMLHREGIGHVLAAFHFGPWMKTVALGRAFVTLGHAFHLAGDTITAMVPRDWAFGATALYAAILLLVLGSYRMLARSA